ncbi:helix-turn-helix domain-containing protein [Proteus hauseri]|uniref:helix-turn-helix domain-containing protein n=1 Tax=Proteus hauseri TaxID=183417 RepID=UPI00100945CC|nr:helix-turn-helix transcriptional regulator [Proteus hauseri]QAV25222.1 hypothetical protein PH4a_10360 [Proteus hauseri]
MYWPFYKKKRKLKNLSGKELGKLLKLSQQQISRYENGKTSFTLEYILSFSSILEMDTFELFEEIELWLKKNNIVETKIIYY